MNYLLLLRPGQISEAECRNEFARESFQKEMQHQWLTLTLKTVNRLGGVAIDDPMPRNSLRYRRCATGFGCLWHTVDQNISATASIYTKNAKYLSLSTCSCSSS